MARSLHPAARTAALAGGIGGALLAGAAGALWHQLLRRPLPRTRGEITVEGLEAPVWIQRDRHGVPHISASSMLDLWFGQGFVHGQERLWQMEFYRRVAAGRVSEFAGEEGVLTDRFMRTLGLRRVAEREVAELAAGMREPIEAYCAGVNAAAEAASARPFEHQLLRLRWERWEPVDMFSTIKILALGLSTNWETELLRAQLVRELGPETAARIDPRYPKGNPVVVQPGTGYSGDALSLIDQIDRVRDAIGLTAEASGSNAWAVTGERSETGKPLLGGDPHLPTSMPGIWYQAELKLGERFVRGASMPGLPGIWMGQNNDVAWSFTNVMADVMDLFVERVDGDRYEFRDEWLLLDVVREVIQVKGRSEPEVLEVRSTHHGPLVSDVLGEDPDPPLALRWSAHDFPGLTETHLHALDVTSGEKLVALMGSLATPVSNLVWADVEGNIGYQMCGRIPIRAGDAPDLPKPGWSGDYEWEDWVPYSELPSVVNPERGYVVSANNRIADEDYPHHITSDYLDGFRAQRIEDLLESRPIHSRESFERIQADRYSIPGMDTVHRLARLRPRDQREVNAIERLKSWDGGLDPDTIAGTIYHAFTMRFARAFTRAVIRDRSLSDRYLDKSTTAFFNHITSPWRWQSHMLSLWAEGDESLIGRSWDELALDALRGALDDLEERYGSDPEGWRWGDVHGLDFEHPLGAVHPLLAKLLNRRLRAGGGQETVNQIAYDPNEPFKGIWAPSFRIIADLADPDRSRWQQFTGQSGHPGSHHYDDLQAEWLTGRTHPVTGEAPFRELTLTPG